MCVGGAGLPVAVRSTRVSVYLEPSPICARAAAGFVCGTINQVSFNKNRKPDERQREETRGVGSYLGGGGLKKKDERRVREKGGGA